MELKWFKPAIYRQGLSYVLWLIRKELLSLQPIDTDDIRWTRSSAGIRAYIKRSKSAENTQQAVTTQQATTVPSSTGYFCIYKKTETVKKEDGSSENVYSVVVADLNDKESGIAGVVKLADGTRINVPTCTLSKSQTKKYVYLVLDVSKTPAVYIMESDINTLTTVLGGIILIGSYTWDEEKKSATITQNIKQSIPVDIGPSYIGPYCILPTEPSSYGIYNYAVNPAGSVKLASALCYVNGESVGYVNPIYAAVASTDAVRAFVGWVAPRYDEVTGEELSSGYVLLSSDDDFTDPVDVTKDITGNTSGMIDIVWRSAITGTVQDILFDDSMLES